MIWCRGSKAAGYAVVLSGNPEEALEKIEKVNPNIILMPHGIFAGKPKRDKIFASASATVKFNLYSLHPLMPGV